MNKRRIAFTLAVTYLLFFAAITLHRSPSGLKKKHFFRRIKERGKVRYKEEKQEKNLTMLVTRIFSLKNPSEPEKY